MGDLVSIDRSAYRYRPADYSETCVDCLDEEKARIIQVSADFDAAMSRVIDSLSGGLRQFEAP